MNSSEPSKRPKSLQEAFVDLNRRHGELAEKNDLEGIEKLQVEYEILLNQSPSASVILFGLGTVKLQLGCNGSAITYFRAALEGMPNSPEIWCNLGNAWKGENNNIEAQKCFEKAASLRESADYYNNLATLYVNEGKPLEGIPFCEKGIAIDPTHARLRWNYSLLLLESGQWKRGLDEYEYGLLSNDRPMRFYDRDPAEVPMWNGEKGTVVVYGEQGMGDEVMWTSCLPDLIAEADRVVFDCHPRMIDLFKRSFPGLGALYPTRKTNAITWPNDDRVDYKLPLGSLFRRYRSDGVFPKQAYLKPDAARVESYRQKLLALGPGPYVGIGWRGGSKKTNAHHRSFKLAHFLPIFEKGGTFISLQYRDEEGKCARFYEETDIKIHHWPDVVESTEADGAHKPGFDYDETVALVAALDLCIVPNTTIVHVCGAIGQNCWTLTPKACAWRYQLEGEEMPMYGPWVRQFRNQDFDEVAEEYARLYRGARSVSTR